jgi:hypothetical protein
MMCLKDVSTLYKRKSRYDLLVKNMPYASRTLVHTSQEPD